MEEQKQDIELVLPQMKAKINQLEQVVTDIENDNYRCKREKKKVS